jgi:hypothetical protein
VIHVPDRSHVHVRLLTLEFGLGHVSCRLLGAIGLVGSCARIGRAKPSFSVAALTFALSPGPGLNW